MQHGAIILYLYPRGTEETTTYLVLIIVNFFFHFYFLPEESVVISFPLILLLYNLYSLP